MYRRLLCRRPKLLTAGRRSGLLAAVLCWVFFTGTQAILPVVSNAQIPTVDLLKGKKEAHVPFSYVHNFIIVELRFQGVIPMQFIYDTGAEYTLLFKREFTDLLGIEYDKKIPILGADQRAMMYAMVCRNIDLQVSPLPSTKEDILVLEEDLFNLEQITGTSVDGLLGAGFFKDYVVEIDYRRGRLIIMDPGAFDVPKNYQQIPAHFKNNKPYTFAPVKLFSDTTLSLELLLDSGAGLAVLLHNNTDPGLQLPEKTITGRIGMGLGGLMKGYSGKIKSIQIGPYSFDELIVSFQDLDDPMVENVTKTRNGIIGNQILRKFNVIIDFPANRVFLKPNRFFNKRIRYDRSGLTIFAVGQNLDQYIVQDVIRGSPADEAGIRVGDRIVRIGCPPISWLTLTGVTRKLQRREGKKIRMTVLRDGKKLKKSFYLQDLL
jgi:hypothetical protein